MGMLYIPNEAQVSLQAGSGITFEATTGSGLVYWPGAVTNEPWEESEGEEPAYYVGAGSGRDLAQFIRGKTTFKGSLTAYIQSHVIAPYAFGANTDAGSPTYTHTIAASGATLPTFKIEDTKTTSVTGENVNKTFPGCSIDTLSIKGSPGEPLELTATYQARTGSYTSNPATAFGNKSGADLQPLKWDGVVVNLSGGGLNGDLLELTGFDFEINNGLQVPYYMANTRNIGQPAPQNREYKLLLNTYMSVGTGGDLYNIFRNGSELNINLWMFRVSGTNAALSDYWQLWMSGCKMLSASSPTIREGTMTQDLELRPSKAGLIVKQADLNWFTSPNYTLL